MAKTLLDIIGKDHILPDLKATSKKEVLEELVDTITPQGLKERKENIHAIILERENLGSTGIGEGIAIPHGKLKDLKKIEVCFGRSSQGIPYDTADGKPVHLFFMMLAPEKAAGQYLQILARLSRFLKNENNRSLLMNADNIDTVAAILDQKDK